jgi:hypothetical protein
MKTIGVITGDIIRSSNLGFEQRSRLLTELKNLGKEIPKQINEKFSFEIIRGDSFQALINKPHLTLKIAILIRAGLRSKTLNKEKLRDAWDARIAIGIGSVDFQRKKLNESDGEAFHYSGHLLESMKKTDEKISIKTPWSEINEEIEVECKLADAIISKWTYNQSEAIYHYWSGSITQSDLAKQLGLSQSALQKRINYYGKFNCIEFFDKRFQNLITKNYGNNKL